MEFSHYDYVPNELAEKVIAAHKPPTANNLSRKKPSQPLKELIVCRNFSD